MPFVSEFGGLMGNYTDPVTSNKKSFPLCHLGAYDFDEEGALYERYIQRGSHVQNGTEWTRDPVYRVVIEQPTKEKWKAVVDIFKRTLVGGEDQVALASGTPIIYFEPDVHDILPNTAEPELSREFPLWVIEFLEEQGAFEQAKNNRRCRTNKPCLSDAGYDRIMKAIEKRKDLEKVKLEQETKAAREAASKKIVGNSKVLSAAKKKEEIKKSIESAKKNVNA